MNLKSEKMQNLAHRHKDKFMYFGVGILAFIVDAGMFTVARKLNLSIGLSNVVGMVSGMFTSFSLNWRVVFKNKSYHHPLPVMVVIFLGLNLFNWWFSTNFIKMVAPIIGSIAHSLLGLSLGETLTEFLAKVGSISIIMIWNFLIYKKIIFKEKLVQMD